MGEYIIPKWKMSEEDIKYNFITPALKRSGWGKHIIFEKPFTDGRIDVYGERTYRQKQKYADYLLHFNQGLPIAVVEAKKHSKGIGGGIQQAINYAEILDVPFAYSSNGDGFLEHDLLTGLERELSLDEFPSRSELWKRLKEQTQMNENIEKVLEIPFYYEMGSKEPRYYQRIAVNRTVEAVARGDKRIMFVMATGTGKTFTAFQIIHRLMKAGLSKRVLFLADRNILVDQSISEDFQPFGNKMIKIDRRLLSTPEMINSYEIYLSLYQQLIGDEGNENNYEKFGADFFDLIIVDEAHRGSAKEDSNWRKILEYFNSATQIGMTATPKEDRVTSNSKYFGKPVYTYSLKQGIDDGFLAPYKVIRVNIDVDVTGYRPEKGKLDAYGNEIPDQIYNQIDFDRNMVIDDRTNKVAKYVSDYLKVRNKRYDKSIFFCVDIDHAERMRQALNNENSDLTSIDSRYVMRITGDNQEGKDQLDNFMDPESRYPSLVTTSKLLTTGVNVKTCKLIVIDSNIGSMTEFKQIIGRGTRLDPSRGKEFFTIIDFRNVTNLFADPDFDGEPIIIDDDGGGEEEASPREIIDEAPKPYPYPPLDYDLDGERIIKYRVKDKDVRIINDQVQVIDADGRLVTESLTDYTKKNILGEYATLDDFLNAWTSASRKKVILEELQTEGVFLDEIRRIEKISSKEIDDFDLLLMLAYGQKPLTKTERVNNVKKRGFLYKYSDEARKVLETLLNKYMDTSVIDIESTEILKLSDFYEHGGMVKIINETFGNKEVYSQAVSELKNAIYAVA